MIVAIAGFGGTGKTTLGNALARKLKYRLISPSFKILAKKRGISLMEFQKEAEKDKNIDLKFDAYLKSEAKKGNCIITTWLGPWIVNADLRIWLFAPIEIRAKRVAKRDNISIHEARDLLKKRENQNRKRYLKLYNIDIFDTNIFDISFNSAKFSPKEMVDIIMKLRNNIRDNKTKR
ncbi:MAG: (d)CMP kinase [Candidatus Micrarchaeota archaeon]